MGWFSSKPVRSTHKMNGRIPTGTTGRGGNLTTNSGGYVIKKSKPKRGK